MAVGIGLTAFFAVFGQSTGIARPSGVSIRNFGQMDDRFYRGAQPQPDDYRVLRDLGIKTIIDLRNDPTDYEKSAVEGLGMKYVNIPMSGWRRPKDEQLRRFLEIANDAETGKFFVHCKAGIHRTGVAGAIYRYENYGWDYDGVYREMKQYNFSPGLFHGSLKSYVKSYWKRLEESKAAPASGKTNARLQ